MTVREQLEQMLINKGMFKYQAAQVVEKAIPHLNELVENYSITYDSDRDEYPNIVYHILSEAMKPIALAWIKENAPQAWFKPMFEEE